jgi:formylglycine-generating enzyme required for sulfatase activity
MLLALTECTSPHNGRSDVFQTPDASMERKADVLAHPDLTQPYDAPLDAPKNCDADSIEPHCDSGLCFIPAGCFMMGSPPSENCREPWGTMETQHVVSISRPFLIQATETTQDQFYKAVGYNPSCFSSTDPSDSGKEWMCWPSNWKLGTKAYCGQSNCGFLPVEMVNYGEAVSYCNTLSRSANLPDCYLLSPTKYSCSGVSNDCGNAGIVDCIMGKCYTISIALAFAKKGILSCPGFRLPTEAEFEYAYRSGRMTSLYNGGGITATNCKTMNCSPEPMLEDVAWSICSNVTAPSIVGKKTPNRWGLYDMAGNVYEICHDGAAFDLGTSYRIDPITPYDPKLFIGTYGRARRGGSVTSYACDLRAAARTYNNGKSPYTGFRCIRTIQH